MFVREFVNREAERWGVTVKPKWLCTIGNDLEVILSWYML